MFLLLARFKWIMQKECCVSVMIFFIVAIKTAMTWDWPPFVTETFLWSIIFFKTWLICINTFIPFKNILFKENVSLYHFYKDYTIIEQPYELSKRHNIHKHFAPNAVLSTTIIHSTNKTNLENIITKADYSILHTLHMQCKDRGTMYIIAIRV